MQREIVEASHKRKYNYPSASGSYICYHYLIEPTGQVIQNRGDAERNGCTMNVDSNNRSIQIVLSGNFDIEHPTTKQLQSLFKLLEDKTMEYGIKWNNITGHTEESSTSCPGRFLEDILKKWRGQ